MALTQTTQTPNWKQNSLYVKSSNDVPLATCSLVTAPLVCRVGDERESSAEFRNVQTGMLHWGLYCYWKEKLKLLIGQGRYRTYRHTQSSSPFNRKLIETTYFLDRHHVTFQSTFLWSDFYNFYDVKKYMQSLCQLNSFEQRDYNRSLCLTMWKALREKAGCTTHVIL